MRQTKNEELMAAGVTIIDPATTYIDPGRRDRRRHGDPPGRVRSRDRAGSAQPAKSRATSASSTRNRRQIRDPQLLPHHRFAYCRERLGRTLRAPAAGVGGGRAGQDREFRGVEEDDDGSGVEGQSSAYLGDATIGERVNVGAGTITCNYDGIKKYSDDHRRRRVHRQRHAADCARARRQGRLRGGRTRRLQRTFRPGRSASRGARQANVEGWVERRKAQSKD